MAEMNIKQIIDRLNAEFTGDTRKLVFWYDDNGEFVEDMQTVTLDNAKVYFLQPDNQFATKLFLERQDTTTNYLVYAPFPKPDVRDNHLEDTMLYSKRFFADRASLLSVDLGIDEKYKPIIEKHIKYFASKERTQRFYDLEIENMDFDALPGALQSGKVDFLAQGTIYPDIIESGTKTVKAVKSHHNVGGLPEDLDFELVEPLKMLFKDEVRACGKALGLPDSMVYRQPFPGPGLGVRCLGAITRDRLEAVRESDAILREEFAKNGLEGKVWQYFTAIPDIKSVGVRDNKRADEWCVIIRAVNTVDAMTATVENVPFDLLQHITARITAEVKGVNRVLFDLTPKPTGTIEWE